MWKMLCRTLPASIVFVRCFCYPALRLSALECLVARDSVQSQSRTIAPTSARVRIDVHMHDCICAVVYCVLIVLLYDWVVVRFIDCVIGCLCVNDSLSLCLHDSFMALNGNVVNV